MSEYTKSELAGAIERAGEKIFEMAIARAKKKGRSGKLRRIRSLAAEFQRCGDDAHGRAGLQAEVLYQREHHWIPNRTLVITVSAILEPKRKPVDTTWKRKPTKAKRSR